MLFVCDGAGSRSKETYTLSARLDAKHSNENAFQNSVLGETTFSKEEELYAISLTCCPTMRKFFLFLGGNSLLQERI